VSERTYTGESVAGEYHGPAVRRDLVGIESVLNAALQQRRQQLHDAGVGLRAIEATVSIKDMTQRAAAGVVRNG
jgi:hypothetical protein